MLIRLILFLLLGIGTAVLLFRWSSADHQNIRATPAAFAAQTPAEQSPEDKVLEPAVPIRILRRAKIPGDLKFTGAAVFTDESGFLAFLGEKNRRYLRWNAVNFANQSVVVFVKQYSLARPIVTIRSVEQAAEKLIVHVSEEWEGDGPRPAMMDVGWAAVVIQKSDPVTTCVAEVVRTN